MTEAEAVESALAALTNISWSKSSATQDVRLGARGVRFRSS